MVTLAVGRPERERHVAAGCRLRRGSRAAYRCRRRRRPRRAGVCRLAGGIPAGRALGQIVAAPPALPPRCWACRWPPPACCCWPPGSATAGFAASALPAIGVAVMLVNLLGRRRDRASRAWPAVLAAAGVGAGRPRIARAAAAGRLRHAGRRRCDCRPLVTQRLSARCFAAPPTCSRPKSR